MKEQNPTPQTSEPQAAQQTLRERTIHRVGWQLILYVIVCVFVVIGFLADVGWLDSSCPQRIG